MKTSQQICEYLEVSRTTLFDTIKKLGLKPRTKNGNLFIYDMKSVNKIKEYRQRLEIVKYKPVYITQTFHIYESKMNYDN